MQVGKDFKSCCKVVLILRSLCGKSRPIKNGPDPKTRPEPARKFWVLNTIFSTRTRKIRKFLGQTRPKPEPA